MKSRSELVASVCKQERALSMKSGRTRRIRLGVLVVLVGWMSSCSPAPTTESGTAPPAVPQAAIVSGNIDRPAPQEVVRKELVVAGWAFATGASVREVAVFVDGKQAMVAAMGGARPDVAAQAPGNPAAATSGWHTVIDARGLSQGNHEVSVRVRLDNGTEKPLGTVTAVVSK